MSLQERVRRAKLRQHFVFGHARVLVTAGPCVRRVRDTAASTAVQRAGRSGGQIKRKPRLRRTHRLRIGRPMDGFRAGHAPAPRQTTRGVTTRR